MKRFVLVGVAALGALSAAPVQDKRDKVEVIFPERRTAQEQSLAYRLEYMKSLRGIAESADSAAIYAIVILQEMGAEQRADVVKELEAILPELEGRPAVKTFARLVLIAAARDARQEAKALDAIRALLKR